MRELLKIRFSSLRGSVADAAIQDLDTTGLLRYARNDKFIKVPMKNTKAFTLLELSIVLLIISVVMGGVMVAFNRSLEQRQIEETKLKMAAIQKALMDYRRAFNRIPCPADATQLMEDTANPYYGMAASNYGVCTSTTATVNFTGSIVDYSRFVTGVSSLAGLSAGTIITGVADINGASYIASIDSATQITLNIIVSGTNAAAALTGTNISANFSVAASTFTGDTTNASAVVTSVSSITDLYVGMMVSGTGIPSGATIDSIDSATQITLDRLATATNSAVTISHNTVVGGMVPTKTLQLPDDYAIDGWGRRIMYAVDVNLTAVGGFANIPATDSSTNRITVNDVSGAAKTTSAVYLLLSFGKNGHGGYTRDGSSTRLANYISADADELTNCHCNSSAVATAFSSTFVQKAPTNGAFDDLVVYGTRNDLSSLSE